MYRAASLLPERRIVVWFLSEPHHYMDADFQPMRRGQKLRDHKHNKKQQEGRIKNMSIGKNIRNMRNERGLTIQQVSDMTGMSITLISKIERGSTTSATLDRIKKICKALQCDESDIIETHDAESDARVLFRKGQRYKMLKTVETCDGVKEKMINTKVAYVPKNGKFVSFQFFFTTIFGEHTNYRESFQMDELKQMLSVGNLVRQ